MKISLRVFFINMVILQVLFIAQGVTYAQCNSCGTNVKIGGEIKSFEPPIEEKGPITGGALAPELVVLKSFTATAHSSKIALEWVTASEVGAEGFYLYRSDNGQDGYSKINDIIIPARGVGYIGASYNYVDTSVANNINYYYKLVEIESSGHAVNYGPIFAMFASSSTSQVAALDDPDKDVDLENPTLPHAGVPETEKDTALKIDDVEEAKFAKLLGVMVPEFIRSTGYKRRKVEGRETGKEKSLEGGAVAEELESVPVLNSNNKPEEHKVRGSRSYKKLQSVTVTPTGIIKWITLEKGKMVLHISNSEKDLKKFGDKLANYLFIDPSKLKKEIHVSVSEIADFYRQNKRDYALSTRLKLRQIFIKIGGKTKHKSRAAASEKINKIWAKIKQGEKFAKVAESISEGPRAAQGGDIGWITRGMILSDLENATFSLKKGKVSRVLRSPGGYHILKVENTWQGRYIPFKKVNAEVKEKLITQKAWELACKKSQDIWRKHWEGYKQSKLMQGKDGYYVVQMAKTMGLKLARR